MSSKNSYLRNPDNYCGPYAIHNAKVWRGDPIVDMDELIKRCRTTNYRGTPSEYMFPVLDQEFEITQRRSNDFTRIKNAINKGCGIILGYQSEHTDGHWAFFFMEDGQIYSVNDRKNTNIVEPISEELFDKYLEKHYVRCVGSGLRLTHPKAWFISK